MSSNPPAPTPPPAEVTCEINGKSHTFPRGTMLVDAIHRVGSAIPYYCYHSKLAPVGACRVCLVQMDTPRGPMIITACTTPVAEGMKIQTMSEGAKVARKQVLQFLLINHPLDCPICDKGGECDLQDFTLAYGPGVSEFGERKIHRRKAADLGPFLVLDQERCILCQRCVRYEDEVLGERNLVLKERGDRTVIDTGQGEPYAGHFSGNNTELCPVGALTSRTYRFKARPWDVHPVQTVCQGCSLGCNMTAQRRNDKLVRLLTRDNPALDGGWLCDRGRYGFGHTTGQERITEPLVRRDGKLVPATWDEAIAAAAEGLRQGAAVLGGGRLTDEEQMALSELARMAIGTNDIDWRIGEQRFAAPEAVGLHGAQVTDIDRADMIVLLATAPAEEAPVLDIRLRRAAKKGARVVELGPVTGFRHAAARHVACQPEALADFLTQLAPDFAAAKSPLIVWNGRGGPDLLAAVAATGSSVLVLSELANARGAEIAGLVPDALPGYHPLGAAAALSALWGGTPPTNPGRDAAGILAACRDGAIHALYLVGANPLRSFPDGHLAEAALARVPFLIVQDLFLTESCARADVVLPAAGPLEKGGHVTGLAGARQAVQRVVPGPGGARPDGVIFDLMARALGHSLHAGASEIEPSDNPVRLQWSEVKTPDGGEGLRVVRASRLYSGGGTFAHDPNFQPVRGEPEARVHPETAPDLEDGDAVELRSGDNAVAARLRIDRAVMPGVIAVATRDAGMNRLGARALLAKAPEPATAEVNAR